MHKFRPFLRGYERETVLAPLFKMLEACFELLVPLVVARIIDTGIQNADVPYIWRMCGWLVFFSVVGLVCSVTAQYFSARAALGFGTALRRALFRHIDGFSYAELDRIGTPTLVTRMTSDSNQVQNGLNLTLRLVLRCPFIVLGAILMAATISLRITLIFLAATALISLAIWQIMRATIPVYKKAQSSLDRVTLLTRENYVGARVVRAFSRQADELAAFTATNDTLRDIQLAGGRISAMMNPLTYLLVNLAIVAILLAGGRAVNAGALRQGAVIALISYMSQILINLLRVADLVLSVTRALASGARLAEILDTPATMAQGSQSAPAQTDADADAVRFERVDFTYRGAGAPSLSGITFAARPGETVGVIGGTGSGKSTLIDLIPRFYDATAGTVRLFGRDVRDYTFAALRGMIGIVPQRAVLFTGTVRDNLRWGKADADDAEIWAALETDQAAAFVREKPGGLDAPVETGGSNFSGGQRQRLTIARALVQKPRLLILDDSSSALDFATDAALRGAIRRTTGDATVFIVSQRASAVRQADRILVLDDGRLAGQGRHAELLQTCPVYREICLSQLSREEVTREG